MVYSLYSVGVTCWYMYIGFPLPVKGRPSTEHRQSAAFHSAVISHIIQGRLLTWLSNGQTEGKITSWRSSHPRQRHKSSSHQRSSGVLPLNLADRPSDKPADHMSVAVGINGTRQDLRHPFGHLRFPSPTAHIAQRPILLRPPTQEPTLPRGSRFARRTLA